MGQIASGSMRKRFLSPDLLSGMRVLSTGSYDLASSTELHSRHPLRDSQDVEKTRTACHMREESLRACCCTFCVRSHTANRCTRHTQISSRMSLHSAKNTTLTALHLAVHVRAPDALHSAMRIYGKILGYGDVLLASQRCGCVLLNAKRLRGITATHVR